jgi:hypothetical protein
VLPVNDFAFPITRKHKVDSPLMLVIRRKLSGWVVLNINPPELRPQRPSTGHG